MTKPIETTAGTVEMSDGARRYAWKNVYLQIGCDASGSVVKSYETRIEFELDTNVNAVSGRRFRKVTPKQAATFQASPDVAR